MIFKLQVALIFGIQGACRKSDLTNLTIDCIEDKGDMVLVKISHTKNDKARSFVITDDSIIYTKSTLSYVQLISNRFFFNYHNRKCSKQVIGINSIGNMSKITASYLDLDKPHTYTRHTYRRTSATLLTNAEANLLDIKHHGKVILSLKVT